MSPLPAQEEDSSPSPRITPHPLAPSLKPSCGRVIPWMFVRRKIVTYIRITRTGGIFKTHTHVNRPPPPNREPRPSTQEPTPPPVLESVPPHINANNPVPQLPPAPTHIFIAISSVASPLVAGVVNVSHYHSACNVARQSPLNVTSPAQEENILPSRATSQNSTL